MKYVLDASAILAWILREPGTERVRQLMGNGDCKFSGVNATEVIAKLADKQRPEAALRQVIGHIRAECIPFDATQAIEAGLLRPATRSLGLSLGDRACLALARREGAVAITADRAWMELAVPLGITIECVRPSVGIL